jgi:hypothetical protein
MGALTAPVLSVHAQPAAPTQQEQRPPIISTKAFASRGLLIAPDLSPDGRRIAATALRNGEKIIVLIDTESRKVTGNYGLPKKYELEWVQWAGPDNLLVSMAQPGQFNGQDVRYTRLILLNLTSAAATYIGRKEPVVTGDDVIFIAPDGEYALVSMQRTTTEYPSVWRFELREGGKASIVERPREGVWNWSADSSGQVRIGTGWRLGRQDIYYRSAAGGDLKRIERLKAEAVEQRGWEVARIEAGSDRAYVFYETAAGRDGFGVMDFARRGEIEPVYQSDKHDVGAVAFDPDGRPRGVHYTEDRGHTAWLTDADRDKQARLSRALKQPEVHVVSRARDDSRMLVWAGSEADPGACMCTTRPKNGWISCPNSGPLSISAISPRRGR